jgi:maltose-binding protein MalE
MKYVKMLACAVVIASFLLTVTACQQEAQGPKQMQLFGSVQKSNNGIVIMSEGKTYQVEGQDLTPMVGKMVEAAGTVTEKDGKYTVTVTSVSESKK